MSQHDFDIAKTDANTGASFRSEVNTALQALASNSKGTTEPAIKYPYQKWADDTTGYMRLRNGANTAWINLYNLEGSAGGLFSPIAGPGSSQAFSVGAFTQTGNALLAQTTGNVLIGTTVDDGVNKLQVNGSASFAGGITSAGIYAKTAYFTEGYYLSPSTPVNNYSISFVRESDTQLRIHMRGADGVSRYAILATTTLS